MDEECDENEKLGCSFCRCSAATYPCSQGCCIRSSSPPLPYPPHSPLDTPLDLPLTSPSLASPFPPIAPLLPLPLPPVSAPTQIPNSATNPTPTPTPTPKSLVIPFWAWIIVGVVAFLLVVTALAVYFTCRSLNRKKPPKDPESAKHRGNKPMACTHLLLLSPLFFLCPLVIPARVCSV